MDVLDFITSQKVLVGKSQKTAASSTAQSSGRDDDEKRCKQLKRVIRAENSKRKPCEETLKRAIDELREIRRKTSQKEAEGDGKPLPVASLENIRGRQNMAGTTDWADAAEVKKRNRQNRRFVFYMPAGNAAGTDVSIGRKRLSIVNVLVILFLSNLLRPQQPLKVQSV
ncbi:uncharacterized protein BXIN_0406 [Babesia sp. Xinjiang]|uniref:uncharacterized protein n=1 Tax=Babesia sp. Xinjiang TaxID=462227 RepID=UPI000A23A507|nr:uncharacterized protein BXIN_0406 [Babesia sp. Xinjiang]ORM41058.1 hypothetical protein BXIN_0406 [Babesia sp. Xinjiang]